MVAVLVAASVMNSLAIRDLKEWTLREDAAMQTMRLEVRRLQESSQSTTSTLAPSVASTSAQPVPTAKSPHANR
jgi:hypothetical protein